MVAALAPSCPAATCTMPSAEWYAARRREKLETHQNALPSEERMVNRTDWDEEFGANLCVTTARAREDAKKKFLALAIDPAVSICETPDQALAYFTPNGPPFTVEVMRKFAEAIAISSRPLLVDGLLSARSCAHTLITLWSASKAARNPVHPDVKEATLHYIYGPLVTKGLIHTMAKEKATAIPEDLSAFIKVLFSPRFAITVSSTREVLLLALFVCLQIDCSSRVSELVVPTLNTEDTKAYKAKHPEKAFLWSSVEIYAYPHHGPGGSVTLRARLTFRGIKDVSKKGYRVKRIPLRLLPPSNVAEDSLFWLVTLGLIDGVFNGISSWNDIDQLQPGEKGLMLRVKYPFREYPVSFLSLSILLLSRPVYPLLPGSSCLPSPSQMYANQEESSRRTVPAPRRTVQQLWAMLPPCRIKQSNTQIVVITL